MKISEVFTGAEGAEVLYEAFRKFAQDSRNWELPNMAELLEGQTEGVWYSSVAGGLEVAVLLGGDIRHARFGVTFVLEQSAHQRGAARVRCQEGLPTEFLACLPPMREFRFFREDRGEYAWRSPAWTNG